MRPLRFQTRKVIDIIEEFGLGKHRQEILNTLRKRTVLSIDVQSEYIRKAERRKLKSENGSGACIRRSVKPIVKGPIGTIGMYSLPER